MRIWKPYCRRFVLVDGLWDLRTRHTIDKVIIKGLDEDEDEEENIDEEEDEEDNLDEEDETSYETNDDADEYEEDDDDLSDFVVIDEEGDCGWRGSGTSDRVAVIE